MPDGTGQPGHQQGRKPSGGEENASETRVPTAKRHLNANVMASPRFRAGAEHVHDAFSVGWGLTVPCALRSFASGSHGLIHARDPLIGRQRLVLESREGTRRETAVCRVLLPAPRYLGGVCGFWCLPRANLFAVPVLGEMSSPGPFLLASSRIPPFQCAQQ